MKRKLFTEDLGRRWPLLIGFGLTAALVVGFFSLKLASLAPASAAEQATISQLGSLGSIASDLVLAPYKAYGWLLLQLPGNDLANIRLASATTALSCIVLFYLLARRWHGRLNAVVATILFATSTWTLFAGRTGNGTIVLTFAVLSLLVTAVWLNKADDAKTASRALVAFAFATAVALLAPGGLWFVLATCLIIIKPLVTSLKSAPTIPKVLAGAVVLAGLAAFAAACASSIATLHQALAIPTSIPGTDVLRENVSLAFLGFFLRGPGDGTLWLAHTPLLDIATSTLLLLGAILYAKHLRNSRTQLLVSFAIIGIVLTVLNGVISLAYLQPIVYLIAASGIAYMMHNWRKVFPRNPVAEVVAVGLLVFMMLAVVNFHVRRYFVAWHASPATDAAFEAQQDRGKDNVPYLIQ